jgi:arginine repressor
MMSRCYVLRPFGIIAKKDTLLITAAMSTRMPSHFNSLFELIDYLVGY